MVRLFVRHQCKDFDVWHRGYKSFSETQKQHGVQAEGVFKATADGNDVTVWHDFKDAAAAQAFVGLPELKSAMAEFGVVGAPTIWITEAVT